MRRLTSDEIRKLFVEFFVERDHEHVPSAPLVPSDDPTLLFTSAGMVPFKPYYLAADPPLRRAVSIQRCLRLSDLEEVGKTPYHDTFFEMLGNFSFGDYFKIQAIEWSWEFLTDVLELPADRLWPTVHTSDEQAAEIWRNRIGVPAERITSLGDEDNFWGPAGDSGPCGPCSELHFDMGEDVGCGRPDCDPGCDCDRFFEIWNLVFPQYMQLEDGTREPLERPGIDTGMGLERLCTVLQGAASIYETDLFAPVVRAVRNEVKRATGGLPSETENRRENAIVADHARAVTFAIAENILPSNEAHGYVIRRLIRRAFRTGSKLGIEGPFLYRVAGAVIDRMGDAHPHIAQKREHVALVIKSEEERFGETLASGTAALEEAMEALRERGAEVVPGDLAFRLYDTYGFPFDLTEEMAAERGLSVDRDGFEAAMEGQRERARSSGPAGRERRWRDSPSYTGAGSRFTGRELPAREIVAYERSEDEALGEPVAAEVLRVRRGAGEGTVECVLSVTPFYAESGGQVADTGTVFGSEGTSFPVVNVYYEGGEAVHVARSAGGELRPGEKVTAAVDAARRRRVEKNHTATHLLQAALRETLGDHVQQSGSWVGPDRLRFDFTHFSEVAPLELEAVEDLVNAWVRSDLPVEPEEMSLDSALERGATALFGEKYGEDVRVVCVLGRDGDEVSMELCGGTHVHRTGEIGLFRIVSESSAAAGVRRIEAVTGSAALRKGRAETCVLRWAATCLKTTPENLPDRVREVADENSSLRKELSAARSRTAAETMSAVAADASDVGGLKVAHARTEAADIPALRSQADELREKLGSGAGVLGSVIEGSAVVVVVVTSDLAKSGKLRAGDIVREVAGAMGGKGGGKPHLAQGGGDPGRLDEALAQAPAMVERLLSG
ncbi:MAG: alanine--tRNA ligase [Candidatus Eisenbacteria bacterium]|nr:alanine--tRNA ligase [Candidatus Eisenbacteria bacterium]